MINFNYELDFTLANSEAISHWLSKAISIEEYTEGDINFIFCTDDYLYQLNVDFLEHDTLTDVISFDYTQGKLVSGDIFISIDRVTENARIFNATFINELQRVMVHGILHFCGYKDKSEAESITMRQREDFHLGLYQ